MKDVYAVRCQKCGASIGFNVQEFGEYRPGYVFKDNAIAAWNRREIMKERPILFSGEMVKAILEGRKTMTRRVVNKDISNQFDIDVDNTVAAYINQLTGDSYDPVEICPYGTVGDRLWVGKGKLSRRTHAIQRKECQIHPAAYIHTGLFIKQTVQGLSRQRWGWAGKAGVPQSSCPPRWACITLEVTDLRVEAVAGHYRGRCRKRGYAGRSSHVTSLLPHAKVEVSETHITRYQLKGTWK